MALCGNPARSDALAVAPRALRACACGAVHIFVYFCRVRVAGCGDRACLRHVAGVPRVCRGAVPWGLGSGRVLYTHGQRAFRVAGCGDRAYWEVCRGRAAGVLAALCRGDWVPGVSHTRMILRAATCVSRGRCGTSDALMRSGRHWTVDPRGRRGESLKSLVFVALCDKSRVRVRVGRCEIVAGAGNPWICGCELEADVSCNAAAGCVGRVACAALCRGMQWQAVTMGVGRVARVACAALCHGDCCWACRVGAAVPWRLLLGVSRGWRCAMGIAAGRLAWVSLGIAGQRGLSVAPCLGDC